jgi:hypothetical protein
MDPYAVSAGEKDFGQIPVIESSVVSASPPRLQRPASAPPAHRRPGMRSRCALLLWAVGTTMPAGVIRSAVDGPTMVITAGLFPSEFCGIEAAGRLYQRLNPADLACGRLIILPCVNLQGFQFRTPWLNVKHTAAAPHDGLNINLCATLSHFFLQSNNIRFASSPVSPLPGCCP